MPILKIPVATKQKSPLVANTYQMESSMCEYKMELSVRGNIMWV